MVLLLNNREARWFRHHRFCELLQAYSTQGAQISELALRRRLQTTIPDLWLECSFSVVFCVAQLDLCKPWEKNSHSMRNRLQMSFFIFTWKQFLCLCFAKITRPCLQQFVQRDLRHWNKKYIESWKKRGKKEWNPYWCVLVREFDPIIACTIPTEKSPYSIFCFWIKSIHSIFESMTTCLLSSRSNFTNVVQIGSHS